MKIAQCLKGVILASGVMFAGVAMAEGDAAIGEKIYQRALGSGCGKCHDVQSNPNLFESVKKLTRDEFKAVMDKGRNGMPPITAAGVMSLKFVKDANLTEDQAVDALIAYLKKGK
jgi:mono/diheme cytochrome c family protein